MPEYTFGIMCHDPEHPSNGINHRQNNFTVTAPSEIIARETAILQRIQDQTCPTCGKPLRFTFDGNPYPTNTTPRKSR